MSTPQKAESTYRTLADERAPAGYEFLIQYPDEKDFVEVEDRLVAMVGPVRANQCKIIPGCCVPSGDPLKTACKWVWRMQGFTVYKPLRYE